MSKNIALLFDGTWNRPSEGTDPEVNTDTNVCRFFNSIRRTKADGTAQVAWYNQGLGTEWMNRIRGGAFGNGLDKHIMDGYVKLCESYTQGDKLFVLGFSRGAYTARSLVGLVRNAGVLREPSEDLVLQAYDLYRARDDGPESEAARSFRDRYSQEIEIEFTGVWDTVGALGVPVKSFGEFNAAKYGFHDTKLSRIVRNAFHALALDEHRKPYSATLWGPQAKEEVGKQCLEQVWFAGAHADVGGGYARQPLSNPPLRWMQRRAISCGLEVDVMPEADDEQERKREYLADARDSFREFLGGAYAMLNDRYLRAVAREEDGHQKLHWTLVRRLDESDRYRPRNEGLSVCIVRGDVWDD